ncbi:MAG: ATP-binding protein [Pseudomonadota bacterium]
MPPTARPQALWAQLRQHRQTLVPLLLVLLSGLSLLAVAAVVGMFMLTAKTPSNLLFFNLILAAATAIVGLTLAPTALRTSAQLPHTARVPTPKAIAPDFETILSALPLPLYLRNRQGDVVFVNDALAALYQSTPQQLVDVVTADGRVRRLRDRELFTPESLADDGDWISEVDGEARRFRLVNQPLDTLADPLELVIAYDITEPHRLQLQLQFSQRLESLGTLASGLAHDFNNLLTPILGYSSLLLDSDAIAAHRDKLQAIADAAFKARRVSKQMLAFSGRQRLAAQRERIELATAAEEIEAFIAATVPKQLTLRRRVLRPAAVLMDAGELNQVLLNLATNAVQALGTTSGTVSIEVDALEPGNARLPTVLRSIPCALISVSDTGPGMSEQLQQHIFEPFFTTKDDGDGSGLGLSIARDIVRQNHGELRCTSSPGEGARFDLFLPALPRQQHESEVPESVLVVEEQPVVLAYLRDVLIAMGYNVQGTRSASEALTLLDRQPNHWRLLVLGSTARGSEPLERIEALAAEQPRLLVLPLDGAEKSHASNRQRRNGIRSETVIDIHRALHDAFATLAAA